MTVFAGDPRAICVIMTCVLLILTGYLIYTLIESSRDSNSNNRKHK